jgi:predicted transcriptional regulator
MEKKIRKTVKRDVRRAATVLETAEIVGVSQSEVQKVLRADRNNDRVLEVFMELTERKNALLEEVKKLIPF